MKRQLIAGLLALTGCVPLRPYAVPEHLDNPATQIIRNLEDGNKPCLCQKFYVLPNSGLFYVIGADLTRRPGFLSLEYTPDAKNALEFISIYDRIDAGLGALTEQDIVSYSGRTRTVLDLRQDKKIPEIERLLAFLQRKVLEEQRKDQSR